MSVSVTVCYSHSSRVWKSRANAERAHDLAGFVSGLRETSETEIFQAPRLLESKMNEPTRLEPLVATVGSEADWEGRAACWEAVHTSDGESGSEGSGPRVALCQRVQQFVNECDESNWY